jgi:hypothetical protein
MMKKVYAIILAMVLMFSVTTAALAAISTSAGGNLVMLLSNDYDSQGETYHGFDSQVNHINVYFTASKSFNPYITAGATMRLATGFYQYENTNVDEFSGTKRNTFETDPWAKWNYDPVTVIVGTSQGDRVGYSNDLDLWGNMYADNSKRPGIKIGYKATDKLTFTGVINSTGDNSGDSTEEATYYYLGKFLYAGDIFQLGMGYQSAKESTGGWDVYSALNGSKLKWNAEYEYRNSQISASGNTYYNDDDTAALLTNLVYEGEKTNWTLRFYKSFNPGFRAISDTYYDPNNIGEYLIDLDTDYKAYDYVRRYGNQATLAGLEFNRQLGDVFSVNGYVYKDIYLGDTTHYYSTIYGFEGKTDVLNYKIGLTQKINDQLSIWYGYKEWYAYEYCGKLTCDWGKGLVGSVELGWGKTMSDAENDDDAHLIAVARLQCTF